MPPRWTSYPLISINLPSPNISTSRNPETSNECCQSGSVRGHSLKLSFPNNHTSITPSACDSLHDSLRPSHTPSHTLSITYPNIPLHYPAPPTLSVHFIFPHTIGNSVSVECLYLHHYLRDFPWLSVTNSVMDLGMYFIIPLFSLYHCSFTYIT